MTLNATAIVPFITLLCYIPLLVTFLRSERLTPAHKAFTAHLIALVVRSFSSFMMHANLGVGTTAFWQQILAASLWGSSVTTLDFAHSLVGRRDRWIVKVSYVCYALFIPVIFSGLLAENARIDDDILHYDLGPAAPVGAVLAVGWSIMALCMLASHYRHETNPLYRKRLLYPLVGMSLVTATGVLDALPSIGRYPIDVGASAIKAMLMSYALLRYQWLDMPLFVRKVLAHAIVTLLIAGVYLAGAYSLHFLLSTHRNALAYVLILAAAAILAVIIQPWWTRVLLWVERVFFPARYDSRQVLEHLAATVNSVLNFEELADLLLSTVTAGMGIAEAAILLPSEETGQFKVRASRGWGDAVDSFSLDDDHPLVRYMRDTSDPVDYADIERLPRFQSLWQEETDELASLGAEIFLPLLVKGELIGIFMVGGLSPNRMHESEDRRTLAALASHASVAVENARLYSESRDRATELAILLHIAETANSTLDLAQVLKLTTRLTARACRADRCSVFLVDESTGAIKPLMSQWASGSHEQELWEAFRNTTYLQHVSEIAPLRPLLEEHQPLIIQDVAASELPREWVEPFGVCSILIVPLCSKGRLIGAMALDYTTPERRFVPSQVNLAATIANQVSIAIDNARLYESERNERRISDTLRDVSSIIGSTLYQDELLQLILAQLEKVISFDRAFISLLQGDRLEVAATRGVPSPDAGRSTTILLNGQAFYREMQRTTQPVLVSDVLADPAWVDSPDNGEVRSWLGAPLAAGNRMIGLLSVEKSVPGYYSPRDVEVVSAVANQAAIAIDKARLYREAVEERRKAETILEETFNGILMVDTELVIQALNRGAELIVGYRGDDLLGKRLMDAFGPEMWDEGSPVQRAIMNGERVRPEESRIAAKDGMRDVLQGVTPLRDDSGRTFGYLLSIADITHLKEMDRLKSALVANVSHELRAPLASIKAYTELLLDDLEGGSRALRQQFLTVIDQETDRLSALITDILDLSRLESGQHKLYKRPLDFRKLVEDVIALLNIQATRRGITFRIEIPADIPPLLADEDLMLTILKNLVSNAVKFSGDNAQVSIEAVSSTAHFTFTVCDQGIGIAPEEISRLFQKFYRTRSSTESGIEGTGLGLVLVKEAVEAHGGSVEVESELQVGSRFIVRIPKEQTTNDARESDSETESEASLAGRETPYGGGEPARGTYLGS